MSNAPTVTPELIESKIKAENYYQPIGTTLTVCFLTLENGTILIGESACVSPERFDAELGKQYAREKAVEKLWALEGYLLKQRLYEESLHV